MTRLVQVAVPNHLGDAVMALRPLRALATALPSAKIRLVGRPLPAQVLDGQGPWEPVSDRWTRGGAAVLLAPSLRVAIGALRARTRPRIGIPTDARRFLLTDVVDADIREHHQRDVYEATVRDAIRSLGGGPPPPVDGGFAVDPRGLDWWRANRRPRFLLHPWAQGLDAKRWPEERWVELGRALGAVAVTGGPGPEDAALARRVATALDAPCSAGDSSLSPAAWAAVSQRVDRAVLPDTGLAHLASAAGSEPVVLFGATDPARYGPRRARIVCGEGMKSITVRQVAEVVRG